MQQEDWVVGATFPGRIRTFIHDDDDDGDDNYDNIRPRTGCKNQDVARCSEVR